MIALMWMCLGAFIPITVMIVALFIRVWRRDAAAGIPAAPQATREEQEAPPWWLEDGEIPAPARPLPPTALITVPRRSGLYADVTGEFARIVAAMERDAVEQAGGTG